MFSSKGFIVLIFTRRPLIHFYLIFVYGIREGSNLVALQVDIQLSQDHLLKRLFFSLLNYPGIFVKNQLVIYVTVNSGLSVLF